jgi:hypothetical protein
MGEKGSEKKMNRLILYEITGYAAVALLRQYINVSPPHF